MASQAASAQVTLPIKWANSQVFNPQSVAFSKDGKWVAVGGWGGAILYSRSTGAITNLEPLGGVINNVSFSPNSRTLAITTENSSDVCVTELWNVANAKLIATIPYPATSNGVIAYAPVGSLLAIAGGTAAGVDCVQIWDTITMKPVQTLSLDFGPASVSFSQDGNILACGGGNSAGSFVKVWDRRTEKVVNEFATSSSNEILKVALSPDGSAAAVCSGNWLPGSLILWDVATGKQIQTFAVGAPGAVLDAVFSADGKTLASAKSGGVTDSAVETWDVATGKLKLELPSLIAGAFGVAYSLDGTALAAVGFGGYQAAVAPDACLLQFWNLAGASTGVVFTAANTVTGPVSFADNGQTLVVPGTLQNLTGTTDVINLYDAQTGILRGPTEIPPSESVTATAYSPTQNIVAIAGLVGSSGSVQTTTLEVRNPITGFLIQSIEASALAPINSMAFSADGTLLYFTTGNTTQKAYVYSLAKGGVPILLPDIDNAYGVDPATTSTVVDFVCGYGMSTVCRLLNVETGNLISSVTSSVGRVLGTAVSPDGRTLAIEGCDIYSEGSGEDWQEYALGYIELWDIASGSLMTTLGGDPVDVPYPVETDAIAFTPDGQYLFAVHNGPVAVSLVDHSFEPLTNGSNTSMAFSPDGSLVASGPWGEEGVNVAKNPFFGLVVPDALTFHASLVTGGQTATATIHLRVPAPAKGAILTLTSSDAHATVPTNVLVPAGKKEVAFKIQTQPVKSKTAVKISAAAGTIIVSGSLVIS